MARHHHKGFIRRNAPRRPQEAQGRLPDFSDRAICQIGRDLRRVPPIRLAHERCRLANGHLERDEHTSGQIGREPLLRGAGVCYAPPEAWCLEVVHDTALGSESDPVHLGIEFGG